MKTATQHGFNWRRVKAIALKEVSHIARDKFTLSMALLLPGIIVMIFGLAIEFNLVDIPTAYLDLDNSQSSREVVRTMGSSNYFQMYPNSSPAQGFYEIEAENAKAFVYIPPFFERDYYKGQNPEVQILIDAADGASAGSILSYLGDMQHRSMSALSGMSFDLPLQLESRFMFNHELNSKWFTVPGLMVIIMTMIAILLTALTVAREWETGSMELLLSTPVRPLEIIIGKLSPYGFLCLVAVVLVYGLARIVFHVPFLGNHIVYGIGCCLFLFTYLAQGLMISVLTRKQMLAMQLSMISGLLPSQLLSGFIFPVENMPNFFYYLTMILPARWFMNISRDSFLQGSPFWALKESFLGLGCLCILFIFIAVKKFKKDLEP